MRSLILLIPVLLAGCATGYQPNGAFGGYNDTMTGSDTAVVYYRGNGFTSVDRVLALVSLRAADLTLQHSYRYFVVTDLKDMGYMSSFTTPGSATTTTNGSFSFGSYSGTSYTTIDPPETHQIYRPGIVVAIKMSNNPAALQGLGMPILSGQRMTPFDAVNVSKGGRQQLGIKGS